MEEWNGKLERPFLWMEITLPTIGKGEKSIFPIQPDEKSFKGTPGECVCLGDLEGQMIYWGRCECLLKMKWKEAALGRESPRPHVDLINSSPTISGELPKKNACNGVPCEAEMAWL